MAARPMRPAALMRGERQYPTVVELMARLRVPASTMRAYSPRRRVFFRCFRPTRTMVRFSPKSFITSAMVPTAARSAYS